MESWKSQNNPGKQKILSVVCAAVGMILTIGCHGLGGIGSDAGLGFLLGLLLLLIGVAGFLTSGKQTVIVDPEKRFITIQDSNRFSTKKRTIPFSDIVDVSIGYLGKKSNFVKWFYLVLKLRSGEDYPLFPPGRFFEGGSDRATVESWKQRLERYLGH